MLGGRGSRVKRSWMASKTEAEKSKRRRKIDRRSSRTAEISESRMEKAVEKERMKETAKASFFETRN